MACGACGVSVSGWLPALAQAVAADPRRRRHCILLWMAGGPSQTDTFDMKPGHENGGEFKEIATNVPGVRFSEHLPRLAAARRQAGDHSQPDDEGRRPRARRVLDADRAAADERDQLSVGGGGAGERSWRCADDSLPPYVSVAPNRGPGQGGFGPGFLGPKFAPLVVAGNQGSLPANADAMRRGAGVCRFEGRRDQAAGGVTAAQTERRLELWQMLENGFLQQPSERVAACASDGVRQRAADDPERRVGGVRLVAGAGRRFARHTARACSGKAACWRGGWSSAACRLSRCR